MPPAFREWPSIARLSRDMVVTEKIDGTNASIYTSHDLSEIVAGSRNRWLTLETDNFGFARWVHENQEALKALGPGHHFGEWWGAGIQRRYGLAEKRFSLFNTHRWVSEYNIGNMEAEWPTRCVEVPVCHVVPVLLCWTFDTARVDAMLATLAEYGSRAAPGFMQPEVVVVFHTKSNTMFKKTLDKNDGHKGAA